MKIQFGDNVSGCIEGRPSGEAGNIADSQLQGPGSDPELRLMSVSCFMCFPCHQKHASGVSTLKCPCVEGVSDPESFQAPDQDKAISDDEYLCYERYESYCSHKSLTGLADASTEVLHVLACFNNRFIQSAKDCKVLNYCKK